MEYKAKSEQVESLESACVLVGVYQKRKLTPTASLLDGRLQGLLESLLKRDVTFRSLTIPVIKPLIG